MSFLIWKYVVLLSYVEFQCHAGLSVSLILTELRFLIVKTPLKITIYITKTTSFMTFHRVCNKSNTKGASGGAETTNPSRAPEFTSGI